MEVASINAELTTWVMEPGTFRPLARLSRHSAHAIVTGHLGTPIRMYDRLGRESGTLDFTVYGKEHGAGFRGWMGSPFRYPGQYADAETGLYYNRFRYYDPEAGQYISQDPIGLQGGDPTLYGYVGDVAREVDVLGLAKCGTVAERLGPLKGKSVGRIEGELTQRKFKRTNPANPKNQRWVHPDGSEVQIHAYGNTKITPYKSGNNAHVHKSIGKHGKPGSTELDDSGLPS